MTSRILRAHARGGRASGSWDQSCAVLLVWIQFTADIIGQRVREVTEGERVSVTLFTPCHLVQLSKNDWDNLEKVSFPIHIYPEREQSDPSHEERQS